jgi:hypothetical protein
MPQNKNIFSGNRLPFAENHKNNNREFVDMAAEQIARLFWEQIKYNHRKRTENTDSSSPTSEEGL